MTMAIYAHGGCVQPTLASKQVCLRGRGDLIPFRTKANARK